MLPIKPIEPPTVILLDPEGMGYEVNEYEWHAMRVWIMKNQAEGWSVKWFRNGEPQISSIDKNGRLMDPYPKEFDLIEGFLHELVGWRLENGETIQRDS